MTAKSYIKSIDLAVIPFLKIGKKTKKYVYMKNVYNINTAIFREIFY